MADGAFIARGRSQRSVLRAAMAIYESAYDVRCKILEQSDNEKARSFTVNAAAYEVALLEAQQVAIHGLADSGLVGIAEQQTLSRESSLTVNRQVVPDDSCSINARIYRNLVRQHVLEGDVGAAVAIADEHLRFPIDDASSSPDNATSSTAGQHEDASATFKVYDDETEKVLKLALDDETLDRERVQSLAGHIAWLQETGDSHAMDVLLYFFDKVFERCESIGPLVYCERIQLMDSSEEIMLFVEDMESIGIEAPPEAYLKIVEQLMVEGNAEAAFGIFRREFSHRIDPHRYRNEFSKKIRHLHEHCVDILLEGKPREDQNAPRRSIEHRMVLLEGVRAARLERYHDTFLRWGSVESRNSATKLFKNMQQNGAAVASHYLIMMQALRNGVTGAGRGSEQMSQLLSDMHDAHAEYINEEEALDAALEALEDMGEGQEAMEEGEEFVCNTAKGEPTTKSVFESMSEYRKWLKKQPKLKRRGSRRRRKMTSAPDADKTTTQAASDATGVVLDESAERGAAYMQAKEELKSDDTLRTLPDSHMASNPGEVWREMPRPILSPVRADANVEKMYQLLHDQYIIEGDLRNAQDIRAQWIALSGGSSGEIGGDIEEYSPAEAQRLRVDLMQSYQLLFQKGNTARADVKRGVFDLFALWREQGLADTELCNLTLQFCDSPEEMYHIVIDGMGCGDSGEGGNMNRGDVHDRPNELTYELLVDKTVDDTEDGHLRALKLVDQLREQNTPLSSKTRVWAQRETWRNKWRNKRKRKRGRQRAPECE